MRLVIFLGIGWFAACGEAFSGGDTPGGGQSGSVAGAGQTAGGDALDASQGSAGSMGTAGATKPDGGQGGGSAAGSGGASQTDGGKAGAGGGGGAGGKAGAGGAAGRAGAGGAAGTGMAGAGGSVDPCTASKAACVQCCETKYAGSFSAYFFGWYECACADPCYPICVGTHCANKAPSFDCAACVKGQMGSATCASDVMKCNADPGCFAYTNCAFGCL